MEYPVDMYDNPDAGRAALDEVGMLTFHRAESQDANTFMGTARRSAITGVVHLLADGVWPSFDVADLWTRGDITGNLRQFEAEQHLFLPIPMAYRSWIYHDLYLQKKVLLGKDKEHAMVTAALSARCIDVHNISAGRWSPLMCYGPMVLLTCLTGDMFTVIPGVLTVMVLYIGSQATNKPGYYRYARLMVLPFRIAFLVVMIMRMMQASFVSIFGFVAALVLILVDFIAGDLQSLMWYRLNCSYEIIKILPNRVFICRRNGASHQEECFGARGRVAESITGLGAWQRSFYIIADIHGVLTELRPVKRETWHQIYDEQCATARPLSFGALDVLSEDYPAINSFGARYKERQAIIEKFKTTVPKDSLLFTNNTIAQKWAETCLEGEVGHIPSTRPIPVVAEDM